MANVHVQSCRPAYALLVEKGGDERAVLAIRGTASVSDGLTDVLGASVEFGSKVVVSSGCSGGTGICEAHAGFVHSARGVLRSLGKDALQEHVFSKQRPLALIGHSLGAATAAAVTVELLEQYPGRFDVGFASTPQEEEEEVVGEHASGQIPLECYSFACPPVFSADICKATEGFITSVVHSDDVICRVRHYPTSISMTREDPGGVPRSPRPPA